MDLIKYLFDPEFGRRTRLLLTLILAVVTALLAFLQGVLDVLEFLPDYEYIGAAALFVKAIIERLTFFTNIGNKYPATNFDHEV